MWSSSRRRSSATIPSLIAARAAAPAGGAPRRDARRADAAEELRRHRRHARQDHDDLAGRGAARCRRLRSDRDQRRHHQRLRHQCAARRRRLDGGRGRRVRTAPSCKLPADVAIVTNVDPEHLDHFKTFDGGAGRLPRVRRERAVLRLRGDVHRPSGRAGAGRPHRGPPHHHLWRKSAGRCAARSTSTTRTATRTSRVVFRDRARRAAHDDRRPRRCRCPAATTRSTRRPRSRSRTSSASPTSAIRKALAGFGGVKRRFTRTGEWNGVTDHRRLRPPSGRDRRGAARRARVDQGPGDRGRAAASLYAAADAVRASSPPASTTPTR